MDLYQTITDRIIKELENGTVPWHKPWKCTSGAISRATGKPYSILNQLMLPQEGEYTTFKQAIEEGHPVRKGEKASMVFFFKFLETEDKETGEHKTVPLLKYYSVFHISQCEGMKPRFAEPYHTDLKPDVRAEQILMDYFTRFGVTLKRQPSDRAYYNPVLDTIVVPEIWQFTKAADSFGVLAHEAVHSTGHPSRLNRITDTAMFGSESYSKEELTAELGSAYLMNTVGLESPSSFCNSAAYIQGWLSALKDDKRFIVSAAGRAERAVEMILNERDFD